MTFAEFWEKNYAKNFGDCEPYYGIASHAFEAGQKNCDCVHTDNSAVIAELENENAKLKSKLGMSIECDKAQKNGELCLGYGGDEDEPCEQCKNCIKCECGYYQLEETEKDKQLTKWHKVADGDLPASDRDVLSDKGEIVFHAEKSGWLGLYYDYYVHKDVIAWCEIPKFEEDE